MRLHGRGSVAQLGERAFEELFERLGFAVLKAAEAGARAIVTVAVHRIADSCGYGVPLMGARTQQIAWLESRPRNQGLNGIVEYSCEKNTVSMDGLPAIDPTLLPDRS